jgi:hypothetical protein
MSKRIRGYNVYKNGTLVGSTDGRSRGVRRRWVRDLVQSTHMGEWKRDRGLNPEGIEYSTVYHYTYYTTIGVYIDFRPSWRSVT